MEGLRSLSIGEVEIPKVAERAEKLEACRKHWYTPVFTSNLGEGGKG